MEKLFSYGTLQKRALQIELFGREVASSEDRLTGYGVRRVQLVEETHKLAVIDAESEINGLVLELTSDELATCDAYEPENYARVTVTLASGETAWAYVEAK